MKIYRMNGCACDKHEPRHCHCCCCCCCIECCRPHKPHRPRKPHKAIYIGSLYGSMASDNVQLAFKERYNSSKNAIRFTDSRTCVLAGGSVYEVELTVNAATAEDGAVTIIPQIDGMIPAKATSTVCPRLEDDRKAVITNTILVDATSKDTVLTIAYAGAVAAAAKGVLVIRELS